MNMPKNPEGIAGLEGREPIGAALTVGIKGANGAPMEKDRFHILAPDAVLAEYSKRDGGSYKAPKRELHPAYLSFNGAAPERRRIIPAALAHATIAELFEFRLQAQSGAKGIPAHPKKAPVCRGNGETAIRWDGTDFKSLPCPGEKCPYSQPTQINGKPGKPACGPFMRFLARFDFPVSADGKRLPSIPFKFTSAGWNSTRNFVGFFDAFRKACAGFGIDPNQVPLFGMPVSLILNEKTNPETQARFPVVSIQTAGDADVIGWIQSQLARGESVRKLARSAPIALAALSSDEELAVDVVQVSGPLSVPAGAFE